MVWRERGKEGENERGKGKERPVLRPSAHCMSSMDVIYMCVYVWDSIKWG